MVLKVKKFFKKNYQKKQFCQKTKSMTKQIWTKTRIFWKFSKVPKFGYFPKVMSKTMFFMFRTHLIHWSFASNATSCMMQQLLLHYQIPQL